MAKLTLKCTYCGIKWVKEVWLSPEETSTVCPHCGDENVEVLQGEVNSTNVFGYD